MGEFKVRKEAYGRETEQWPEYQADWEYARAMPADARGEWVPWRVIKVDDKLSPREGPVDAGTVERYREHWRDLPPIKVQKDTFVLIDGWHRYHAHLGASDAILIEEVESPDDELFIHAYTANIAHGRPLTDKERGKTARAIWDWYIAKDERPSPSVFARTFGVARETVHRWGSKQASKVLHSHTQDITAGDTHTREVPLKPRAAAPERRVPDPEPVQWSDEEHPVAFDDDGEVCASCCESAINEGGLYCTGCEDAIAARYDAMGDPAPEPTNTLTAALEAALPETGTAEHAEMVARAASAVDPEWAGVLRAIEAMAELHGRVRPVEFLTPLETTPEMQRMTLVDFTNAADWLASVARWLRVGRED